MDQPSSPPPSRETLWILRGITLLIALVLIGLGVTALVTNTYYGRTTKLGGAEVVLEYHRAWVAGCMQISLGLLPLALWFRTRRTAKVWVAMCVTLFAGFLIFAIALR